MFWLLCFSFDSVVVAGAVPSNAAFRYTNQFYLEAFLDVTCREFGCSSFACVEFSHVLLYPWVVNCAHFERQTLNKYQIYSRITHFSFESISFHFFVWKCLFLARKEFVWKYFFCITQMPTQRQHDFRSNVVLAVGRTHTKCIRLTSMSFRICWEKHETFEPNR